MQLFEALVDTAPSHCRLQAHLSQKRIVGFILLLYLLLPPLLHAVAHIRLEPEAQRDHRVPDAGIQTDNFNFPQNFQFT